MSFEDIFDFHPNVPVLLIGEYHGNPGSFEIFDSYGNYLLSIYMDVAYSRNFKSIDRKREAPVVTGNGDIAETVAKTLSFKHMEQNSDELCEPRCIVIDDNTMDFMDSGKSLFSFRIKSYKLFDKGGRCEDHS